MIALLLPIGAVVAFVCAVALRILETRTDSERLIAFLTYGCWLGLALALIGLLPLF